MDKKILLFLSLGIVGVLYVLWNVVDTELEEDESEEASPSKMPKCATPFIPTHEWQEVKEGQAVPPGLSIRFDLATGKNYAKLLDEEPKKEENVYHMTADLK
ncbi:hypothetical protein BLSTO_02207 [Blastocystis sp. subtype 1]